MVLKLTSVIEVGAATMNSMKKLPPPENPKVVITIDGGHSMFGHYNEPTTMLCAYTRGYGISRGTLKPVWILRYGIRLDKEKYQK